MLCYMTAAVPVIKSLLELEGTRNVSARWALLFCPLLVWCSCNSVQHISSIDAERQMNAMCDIRVANVIQHMKTVSATEGR